MNLKPNLRGAAAALFATAACALFVASPSAGDKPAEEKQAGDACIAVVAECERDVIAVGTTPQTIHLNIQVVGGVLPTGTTKRAPLNVVFVLDKSGSMNADNKWGYVRQSLENAFRRFGVEDYVSLVAYDTDVQTVFQPTRNLDADWAAGKLRSIAPDGSTNLYGGLEEGAKLASEHFSKERVNRVVLLSDGLANVGPSSTRELRALAESLTGKGLRISTVGVGADYNEDLMLGVAKESGGAYYFIDEPERIAAIFDEELSGLMSVVARDLEITVTLPEGVACKGSLDKADQIRVDGDKVRLRLPEAYANQTSNLMLELVLSAGTPAAAVDLATIEVAYADALRDNAAGKLAATARVAVSASAEEAAASINEPVLARVLQLKSISNREQAMMLMDQGREGEAQALLTDNSAMLSAAPASIRANEMVAGEAASSSADAKAYEEKDETARKASQYTQYQGRK